MLIRVVPIIVVAASLLFPLTSPAAEDTPAAGVADAVTVRGIVDAIDRTLGTVALLRRERGLLVLEVRDPAELGRFYEQTVRPLDAYGALAYLKGRSDVAPDRIEAGRR